MTDLHERITELQRSVRRLQFLAASLFLAMAGMLFMAQAPDTPRDLTVRELRAEKIVVTGAKGMSTTIFPEMISIEGGDKRAGARASLGLLHKGFAALKLGRWGESSSGGVDIDVTEATRVAINHTSDIDKGPNYRTSKVELTTSSTPSLLIRDGDNREGKMFVDRIEWPAKRPSGEIGH